VHGSCGCYLRRLQLSIADAQNGPCQNNSSVIVHALSPPEVCWSLHAQMLVCVLAALQVCTSQCQPGRLPASLGAVVPRTPARSTCRQQPCSCDRRHTALRGVWHCALHHKHSSGRPQPNRAAAGATTAAYSGSDCSCRRRHSCRRNGCTCRSHSSCLCSRHTCSGSCCCHSTSGCTS
jgi:hypothetical protein